MMLVGTEYLYSFYDTFAQFTHVCTTQSSYCFVTEGKRFKPDLRVVHVSDPNFVLRSEIFVHTDG